MADTFLTQAQARAVLYTHWDANWPILQPNVPYQKENLKFSEPSPPTKWARVSLRHLRSEQDTMGVIGQRIYERPANIWCQFFGPVHSGNAGLDALCDSAKSFLEGVSFGGIVPAGAADPQEIGEDGRWYEVVLIIPVTYYERK